MVRGGVCYVNTSLTFTLLCLTDLQYLYLFKQSEHVQSRRCTNVTSEIMGQSRGHCRVFNLDLNFVNTVLSWSADFDFLIDEHLFGSCSSPRVWVPYSCFRCT